MRTRYFRTQAHPDKKPESVERPVCIATSRQIISRFSGDRFPGGASISMFSALCAIVGLGFLARSDILALMIAELSRDSFFVSSDAGHGCICTRSGELSDSFALSRKIFI